MANHMISAMAVYLLVLVIAFEAVNRLGLLIPLHTCLFVKNFTLKTAPSSCAIGGQMSHNQEKGFCSFGRPIMEIPPHLLA